MPSRSSKPRKRRARLLALCHAAHVPVVAWGAGTSLEGHVTPVRGGITLDLSRMTRIIDVSQPDMDCRIEAGVTRDQLNDVSARPGTVLPGRSRHRRCAPSAGMCATRASGTNAVRYGTIRENVLGLTVALADGRLIRTGGRVRKSATGYDLTRLFIGSEGTLGVITEIQLRLHGIPEAMSSATCQFPTLRGAVETVIAILQMRHSRGADGTAGRGADGGLHRLFEAGGSGTAAHACSSSSTAPPPRWPNRRSRPRRSQPATADSGFRWATDAAERGKLWQARHDALWACLALKPGHKGIATDAIVPISRLDEAILGAKEDIAASGLTAPIVGHVGDGNFHTVILVPPEPDGLARAWDARQEDRGAGAVARRFVQRRAWRRHRQARIPRAGARARRRWR